MFLEDVRRCIKEIQSSNNTASAETVVWRSRPKMESCRHRSASITFDGNALRIHVEAGYKRMTPDYFFPEARLHYGMAHECPVVVGDGRKGYFPSAFFRVGVALFRRGHMLIM